MATLLTRISESVADKVFGGADYIMRTNRKVEANGAVDDMGGYANGFLAVRIAEWIEEAMEDEKETPVGVNSSLA